MRFTKNIEQMHGELEAKGVSMKSRQGSGGVMDQLYIIFPCMENIQIIQTADYVYDKLKRIIKFR